LKKKTIGYFALINHQAIAGFTISGNTASVACESSADEIARTRLVTRLAIA